MKFSRIQWDGIQVWLTQEEREELVPNLTSEQITYTETLKLEKRRSEFMKSRALLNFATDHRAEFRLPHAGPCQHGSYWVSISHKDNIASVAISKTYDLLGVDLERIKSLSPPIRNKVLTPTEIHKFSEDQLPTLTAFSYKEAVYKALNLTYPNVKYFHQCEILSWSQGLIEAEVSFAEDNNSQPLDSRLDSRPRHSNQQPPSLTTLSLKGMVGTYDSITDTYVVSLAYVLKK